MQTFTAALARPTTLPPDFDARLKTMIDRHHYVGEAEYPVRDVVHDALALARSGDAAPQPPAPEVAAEPTKVKVRLDQCPVGLFRFAGMLCFRSEYSSARGQPDAYVIESGEYFWGGTRDIAARSALMVEPIAASQPSVPEPAAWGVRSRDGKSWSHLSVDDRSAHHSLRWEPLYTTPQPVAPASGDAVREALVDMLGLFTPNGYLFASGEHQIAAVERSRVALARTGPSPAPANLGEIEGLVDTPVTRASEDIEDGRANSGAWWHARTALLTAWTADKARIAELERQLAEARAQAAEGGADLLRQADAKLHDAIEAADGRLKTMLDEVHDLVHRAEARLADQDRAAERREASTPEPAPHA